MKDKIVEILKEFKVFEKTLDDNTEINSAIDHHKMALYKARRILAEQIAHLYSAGEEVYVTLKRDEAITSDCVKVKFYGDDGIELPGHNWLKKLTRPTVSEEEIAVMFHDAYEDVAKEEGWNTQNKCKVPFNDLPEANKRTMIRTAKIVKELLNR